MSKVQERKLISDAMWKKLEPAVLAAKHFGGGSAAESEREFLEALLISTARAPVAHLPAELGYWHAV